MRLSMWSGPRNVSTALMYSFRERSDTQIFDEPLYGHYLRVSDAEHPGDREIMREMDTDGERVVREVLLAPCEEGEVRFYKNMAHHLSGLDKGFLSKVTNALLVRDPREMLPSLAKQIPAPALRDTGLREQTEVLNVMLAKDEPPVVLDARELLLNPALVLEEACRRLGIPFEKAMLSWPAGPKPEDGIWAKHWYKNVHASTRFGEHHPKTEPFPEHLEPLLEECLPLYEKLRTHTITAGG